MEHLDTTSFDFFIQEENVLPIGTVSNIECPPKRKNTMQKKRYATQIGIGTNKYYCADPTERTLHVEQYPIGFFLSFPLEISSILKKIQSLIETKFCGYAHLEIHTFESDRYAFLYFNNATQLREFLKTLANFVYYTDKATNKKLTMPRLYKQAQLAYSKAIA